MSSNKKSFYTSSIYIISFTNTTTLGNEFITSAGDTGLFTFDKWDQTKDKDALHSNDIATGMSAVMLTGETENDPRLFLVSLSTDSNPKRILPIALKYDQQSKIPVLGFIFLVDISYWTFTVPRTLIRRDGTREEVTEGYYFVQSAKEQLRSLIELTQSANYVVVAVAYKMNKMMPLDEVRNIIDIEDKTKILSCDSKSKKNTRNILLELLKSQDQTTYIKDAIEIVNN